MGARALREMLEHNRQIAAMNKTQEQLSTRSSPLDGNLIATEPDVVTKDEDDEEDDDEEDEWQEEEVSE